MVWRLDVGLNDQCRFCLLRWGYNEGVMTVEYSSQDFRVHDGYSDFHLEEVNRYQIIISDIRTSGWESCTISGRILVNLVGPAVCISPLVDDASETAVRRLGPEIEGMGV